MIRRVKDKNGWIVFAVETVEIGDAWVKYSVESVGSWDGETGEPFEPELYLHAHMKWDGCCHVTFGERLDEHGNRDGYLHLCGHEAWHQHVELMRLLWQFAREDIDMHGDEPWGDVPALTHESAPVLDGRATMDERR